MVNLKMATQYNMLLNSYICLLFMMETHNEKKIFFLCLSISFMPNFVKCKCQRGICLERCIDVSFI